MGTKEKREKRERRVVSAKGRAEAGTSLMFERPSLKIPKGAKLASFDKEDTFRFNVIPYELKKDHGNKSARGEGLGEGDLYWERTYVTHRQPGASGDSFCCLRANFGKACPICEKRAQLAAEGADKEELKPFNSSFRQLMNVQFKGEDDIVILDSSTFGFGDLLNTRVNSADPDDEDEKDIPMFPDLADGKLLKVTTVETAAGKGSKWYPAKTIEFKTRAEPLDDDLIEKAFNLDDMIVELPYAELKKRFFAAPGDDEEAAAGDDEDEAPKKKKTAKPADDDDDDDDDDEPKKKPAAKKKPADDDDDDEPRKKKRDADEDDDEPKAKKKKPADDDEDDDDGPVPADDEEFDVGDMVRCKFNKKTYEWKLKKLNATKGLAFLPIADHKEGGTWVEFADLTKVEPETKKKKPADDDDDDEPKAKKRPADDDDDDEPKKKKKPADDDDDDEPRSRKKKPADDDDDDDDD